jgi:hypothetical protein
MWKGFWVVGIATVGKRELRSGKWELGLERLGIGMLARMLAQQWS